ncbi:TIP-1 family-domain-containing protein [Cunninghamella echinulata]|nr:TIP-1 family-domain-containing protein [Cunninghamella echinulata]
MSPEFSVNDYLNEQFPIPDAISTESLQALLNKKTEEYEHLQTQLSESKKTTKNILETTLKNSLNDKSTLDELYESLTTTKNEIAQVCAQHQIGDHQQTEEKNEYSLFVQNLVELEHRLKIMDSATSYIKTLYVTMELWNQTMKAVEIDHYLAIQKYILLLKFVKLVCTQDCVKTGSFKDLGLYLEKCQLQLWEILNNIFTKKLKASLKELNWPAPLTPPYGPQVREKLKVFEKSFQILLLLQHPYNWNQELKQKDKSTIISPIRIMLEDVSIRFRFHFEGNRPTNRLDKPEWYLKHTKNQISTHIPFIITTLQPIVNKVYGNQELISAKDHFIEGVLKDVIRKLLHSIPKLLSHPNWLSHTINELLLFDQSLKEEYGFVPLSQLNNKDQDNSSFTMVASSIFLMNQQWYNTWFSSEKQFAQSRYDDIIGDTQAFDLYEVDDDDDMDNTNTVATKSSMKLIQLLDDVTDTYKLIPSFLQKFQFFTSIQLSLLVQYYNRLESAIDSFESLSLIRSVQVVPGKLPDAVTGVISTNDSNESISGLKKIYKWWASAKKIIMAIQDWEDDDFYLNLNMEAEQHKDIVMDIRKNSEQMKAIYILDVNEKRVGQTIFSSILLAYQQLLSRAEKICVKLVAKEWTTNSKQYSKIDVWWQSLNDNSIPLEVSNSLYQPLNGLWTSLKYLHHVYPQSHFLLIYKQISLSIEDWYWRNIITKNQFSRHGVNQLETDFNLGLWKIGKRVVNKPENYTRRLKEALQVFNLLLTPSSEEEKEGILACSSLLKALTDPEQQPIVQKTLDRLGIDTLSNSEIRDVLRRRNDMLNSWN